MDNAWQIMISTIGLALLVIATIWLKWGQTKKFLREVAEALTQLSAAIEDDDVTEAELQQLLADFQEVIVAAKALFAK